MESLEDYVAFFEASQENVKGELSKATVESTRLGELFDGARVQFVDLQEKLAAKKAIFRLSVQDLCENCEPSPKGLVEEFRIGSIDAQFHSDSVRYGTTLHLLGGAISEEGMASTKCEDDVDHGRGGGGDAEVNDL